MNFRAALLVAVFPAAMMAQVGYPPAASPYHDVENGARGSAFTGWYSAAHDPAGVFPKSAPIYGVRWDVYIGGPADFTAQLSTVPTKRDVIDPSKPEGHRFVESQSLALSMAEIGIAFSLTGGKSWHTLVPQVNTGVGLISDFQGRDAGGYQHGTTFALHYGLGLRIVPPEKRLSLRADIGSYFYSTEYPSDYFVVGNDGTSVLKSGQSGAKWRNNWAMTLGATYVVFR